MAVWLRNVWSRLRHAWGWRRVGLWVLGWWARAEGEGRGGKGRDLVRDGVGVGVVGWIGGRGCGFGVLCLGEGRVYDGL